MKKYRCTKCLGNFSVLSAAEISFMIDKIWHFSGPNFRVVLDRKEFDHPIQWNECCFRAISRSQVQLLAKVQSSDVFLNVINLHESVFIWRIRHTHEVMYFPTSLSTIFFEKNVTIWRSPVPTLAQRTEVPVAYTCTRKEIVHSR